MNTNKVFVGFKNIKAVSVNCIWQDQCKKNILSIEY